MHFTKDHEWIRVADDIGIVGITEFAQEQLGDIVFVELPEKGAVFAKGEQAVVIESVKAASEAYAPVGGEIVEVNGMLEDQPETVNAEAEAGGWFFKIRITDPSELDSLLDEAAYKELTADA
jgi:glycine cleavage system H protein